MTGILIESCIFASQNAQENYQYSRDKVSLFTTCVTQDLNQIYTEDVSCQRLSKMKLFAFGFLLQVLQKNNWDEEIVVKQVSRDEVSQYISQFSLNLIIIIDEFLTSKLSVVSRSYLRFIRNVFRSAYLPVYYNGNELQGGKFSWRFWV